MQQLCRIWTSQTDVGAAEVNCGQNNGYQPSQGSARCRSALASFFNVAGRPTLQPKVRLGNASSSLTQDVFMTLGCSEALSHCIAALAAPGSTLPFESS